MSDDSKALEDLLRAAVSTPGASLGIPRGVDRVEAEVVVRVPSTSKAAREVSG